MTKGTYDLYELHQAAENGKIVSVYTDSQYPEEFETGVVEEMDGNHFLLHAVNPWGLEDGWRLKRNRDLRETYCSDDYEIRMSYLMQYKNTSLSPLLMDKSEDSLQNQVLQMCRKTQELITVIDRENMITGRIQDVSDLILSMKCLDFYGFPAGEQSFLLRDIQTIQLRSEEERMYLMLEEKAKEQMEKQPQLHLLSEEE